MIQKVLASKEQRIYWKDGDIHCKDGLIQEAALQEAVGEIKTHLGKTFTIYPANAVDQMQKLKRGPQTLLAKDLAYILYYSAVNKDSIVIDAGSGCGFIAITLARYAKKVVSYDIRAEHLKITAKNIKRLGLENIELKEKDVYEGIDEKDADILTLDLAEPWRVDTSCLKNGATILVYLPTITQVMEFCKETKDHVEKVVELLEREWHVQGRRVRPKSQMQGHTAFLIIARKP